MQLNTLTAPTSEENYFYSNELFHPQPKILVLTDIKHIDYNKLSPFFFNLPIIQLNVNYRKFMFKT